MSEVAGSVIQDLLLDAGEFQLGAGEITEIDKQGRVYVRYGQDGESPTLARTTIAFDEHGSSMLGLSVLLAIPDSTTASPIILGVMRDAIIPPENTKGTSNPAVDSENIVVEAVNSLSLRCGKGEIIIRRDGEIVIRGLKIVSRAAQTNKLKGATVLIN